MNTVLRGSCSSTAAGSNRGRKIIRGAVGEGAVGGHEQAVGVEDGQGVQQDVVGPEPPDPVQRQRVRGEVALGQHGALGPARRAAGVEDGGEVVGPGDDRGVLGRLAGGGIGQRAAARRRRASPPRCRPGGRGRDPGRARGARRRPAGRPPRRRCRRCSSAAARHRCARRRGRAGRRPATSRPGRPRGRRAPPPAPTGRWRAGPRHGRRRRSSTSRRPARRGT